MWENIGRRLQSLAKILCWIGIIASVIMAIVMWSQKYGNESTAFLGFLYLVLGCLGSWIGSWAMYGLGIVVEYVENKNANPPLSQHEDTDHKTENVGSMFQISKNSNLPVQDPSLSKEKTSSTEMKRKLPVKYNINPDWPDDGEGFVKCPRCNKRMSIDFVNARKKCPECDLVYRE